MKIVLFGDSLLAQAGKHRIESLEAKLPGADVYNCAAGGWNSDDCLKKSLYIANLNPDTVIMSLGTNDAAPWKQLDLELFKENLPKIFNTFSKSELVYFLPPPVSEAKESKQKFISNIGLKQYYDTAAQLAKDNNIKIIDSWNLFMPMQEKGEDYHVEDGVHLKDVAYEIVFAEVAKILR
jgi:lysophospholipase L1-like esterase